MEDRRLRPPRQGERPGVGREGRDRARGDLSEGGARPARRDVPEGEPSALVAGREQRPVGRERQGQLALRAVAPEDSPPRQGGRPRPGEPGARGERRQRERHDPGEAPPAPGAKIPDHRSDHLLASTPDVDSRRSPEIIRRGGRGPRASDRAGMDRPTAGTASPAGPRRFRDAGALGSARSQLALASVSVPLVAAAAAVKASISCMSSEMFPSFSGCHCTPTTHHDGSFPS